MNRRSLGRTGLLVSEIGLGGWQLANPLWGTADESAALNVIQAALDAGCNFFDTAPGYAEGQSEALLGRALKQVRKSVLICTKFGHAADGESDFTVAALRPALDASLRRLHTDYVDVLLVHNPPAELMDGARTSLYQALERLKTEGKLRAYGVSVDSRRDLEKVIESTGSDVAEILFNVFHQEPLPAFQNAEARGVGLIVKVPLDSGWLTGKYSGGSRFSGIRERWTPDTIARRARLVEQFSGLVPSDRTMTHAALQFILAQAQVSTVIPGAKTAEQVRDNFAAADTGLTAMAVEQMRAFWEREIKDHPLPW